MGKYDRLLATLESEGPTVDDVTVEVEIADKVEESTVVIDEISETTSVVTEATMLYERLDAIKEIIKEDGLPLSTLKVLQVAIFNDLRDTFNEALPSVEDLDVIGTNEAEAEKTINTISDFQKNILATAIDRNWQQQVILFSKLDNSYQQVRSHRAQRLNNKYDDLRNQLTDEQVPGKIDQLTNYEEVPCVSSHAAIKHMANVFETLKEPQFVLTVDSINTFDVVYDMFDTNVDQVKLTDMHFTNSASVFQYIQDNFSVMASFNTLLQDKIRELQEINITAEGDEKCMLVKQLTTYMFYILNIVKNNHRQLYWNIDNVINSMIDK